MVKRPAIKSEKRMIRIYIASPCDHAVERPVSKDVIAVLNDGFGDGVGVKFEALGWTESLS